MRISKILLTVCAAGACALLVSVRADDNPAQAAARAALMEKLNGTDDQSGAMPQQTNPPAQPTPPPIVVMPNGATVEQPNSSSVETNVVPTPAPAPTMPADVENKSKEASDEAAAKAKQDAEMAAAQKKADEAAAKKAKADQAAAEAKAKKEAKMAAEQKKSPAATVATETGATMIEAPPLPISAAKQAQLGALLEKYKADQITPAEYQAERAKILAQP
jgi:hypothetical protein